MATSPLAITGDTSFSSTVSQGTAPSVLITPTSANDAAGGETWRQRAVAQQEIILGDGGGPAPAISVQPTLAVAGQLALHAPVAGWPSASSTFQSDWFGHFPDCEVAL